MSIGLTNEHRNSARGRPEVTSHGHIEQVAFTLFAVHGFATTTLADIAAAVGVSRRTITRYYPSKNDIPWGQFDRTLAHFHELLNAQPADVPTSVAVHRAVVEFNRFPDQAQPSHRERMQLILTTPELQAHSVLRYAQWRRVIVEHVAQRHGGHPDDLLPQTVGHVSLALSLAAYEHWLAQDDGDLVAILDRTMGELRRYLD